LKWAVVSDVHANAEALRAVLAEIEAQNVDDILCLGDIVGYGASPNEVVRMLRAVGAKCIAGNHDRAAIGVKDPSDFGRMAKRAIGWTKRELCDESRAFLASLPMIRKHGDEVLLFHGALHPVLNDDLHLSNPARIQKSITALRLGGYGVRVGLFGHTHWPGVWRERDGVLDVVTGETVQIDDGAHYLINPGSVGQPRDGDERASFAIFDTGERTSRFVRVDYNRTMAMAKAARAGLVDRPSPIARARARAAQMVTAALAMLRES
jgi:predicted phosphodiesterase